MNPELQQLLKSLDYSGEGNGVPNGLCAKAAVAIRELLEPGERCWLIETARNTWWNGRHVGDAAVFASDANDACRFARFEDAEAVRCWLLEGEPGSTSRAPHLRSVEHVFINKSG